MFQKRPERSNPSVIDQVIEKTFKIKSNISTPSWKRVKFPQVKNDFSAGWKISLDFSDFWFSTFISFSFVSALKYKTRRLDKMTQHPKLFFLDTQRRKLPEKVSLRKRISRFFIFFWFLWNWDTWEDSIVFWECLKLSVWCL